VTRVKVAVVAVAAAVPVTLWALLMAALAQAERDERHTAWWFE